ncbi:MAG: ATP-binding cassette domain-containing protein, partial [Actinomycetota bacterium]|nr:ATP-binding cassette domain-containing protein [Actinomycetota bacterium]
MSDSASDARPGVSASAGLPQALPDVRRRKAAAAKSAIFSLADVRVAYGGVSAVEDVTFDLLENEITAFIGPSGCGKSTLIRCLN